MKRTSKTIKMLVISAVLGATVTASAMSASAIRFEDMDDLKILESTVEDCQNTYKAYDINDYAMFHLENGSSFKSVFTDTCKVFGQYESAYMMFIESNGKTEFADAQGLKEGMIVPNVEAEAKKIINAQGYKATDMVIGRSRDTKCYLVYFTTDDGEYVLPIHDIKWYNIKTGKAIYNYIKEGNIYTTDEFVAALKKYSEDTWAYEGLLMGDADNNKKVDIRDCAKMARAFAKHSDDTDLSKACDYNMDSMINVRDCADLAGDLANK